jgi:hypothetical protein
MSKSRKLTIPIEGASHSEERSGGEERPKEMHKVVCRFLRTNGGEDHSFSLHAYRKVMYIVANLKERRTVPFMLVERHFTRSSQTTLGQKC